MHALFGWMFEMYEYQTDEELQRAAGDLMQDPFLRKLGDTHSPYQAQLCLGVNVVLRLIAVAIFGWAPVLVNTAAMLIVFVSTQLVNAVCHLDGAGYRLHDTREGSRNVWWVAVLTLGEGWHNNHHAVPKSARHGMAWWEIDVTWISIWLLEKLGLGSEVVRPPAHKMPGYKPRHQKAGAAASVSSVQLSMPVEASVVVPHAVPPTTTTAGH
jgi:stearoyl-CoA desaturase (delta-9 desaturase)